jgi:hypothetical protein
MARRTWTSSWPARTRRIPRVYLRVELTATAQGPRLTWNTQPGLVYQPQVSADIGLWHNLGEARFAPGAGGLGGADGTGLGRLLSGAQIALGIL